MLGQLRIRVQASAGVVEVDVAAGVQAPIFATPEFIEDRVSRGVLVGA
jgi:hypothetical protein